MAGFQGLNSNTYVLSGTTSSSSVTFTTADEDITESYMVAYNAGSVAVFLVAGDSAAPTAVFPTSATVPVSGKVVAPGATVSFKLPPNFKYISGITASGTATVYISVGYNP